ncbi:LacI family transcriptional regulator [Bifidobacterium hapali]|uniref:LacI family transcriptional regulator n=1 Tax=Bifidobacterium hapali TaxID=1630172 RepID=A0A261FZ71_9BIFI|nr:LacI family transcriptional regulator [Bifidobacterium hapali]
MARNKTQQRPPSLQQRATLTEIAAQLKLSTATVSKVLNGKPDVSPATRDKVQAVLEEMNYRKNRSAAAPLIDVVLERLDNVWGLEVITGVERAARDRQLGVVITETLGVSDAPSFWVDACLERNPIGVILVLSNPAQDAAQRLSSRGIPYVLLDPSGDPNPNVPSIKADNWGGGLAATRHLLALGHTHIGVITGRSTMLCSQARLAGHLAALAARGIPADDSLIKEGDFTTVCGRELALQLLDQDHRPTAIVAGNDLEAMGVYDAAHILHLRIPDDLSVVGFDDVQTSAYMGPSLTTIRQPIREMSSEAVNMLLRRHEQDLPSANLTFPTELIIRGSTASPYNG